MAEINPEAYATHWVLVKFKPDSGNGLSGLSTAEALTQLASRLAMPLGARLREPAINEVLRAHRDLQRQGQAAPALDLNRFLYLDLPPGLEAAACVQRLRGHPDLEYAELDGRVQFHLVPCDQDFDLQPWLYAGYGDYYMDDRTDGWPSIHAREAWDITTGSTNVTVAVVDTGIDPRLIELAGRVVPGWNVIESNASTMDGWGHGTIMAVLLGANANNPPPEGSTICGWSGVGVDWQCRLMSVKVMTNGLINSLTDLASLASWAAQGIDYASAHGCKVINVSWSVAEEAGAHTVSLAVSNAISRSCIVVCPGGDSGNFIDRYPAKYDPAITVVSSLPTPVGRHSPSTYACAGPELDLMAPELLWSLMPSAAYPEYGQRTSSGGSSGAAALVSGVCALLASVRPDITHDQARLLLCAGADDQGAPGFDNETGWGELNAYDTLLLATTRIDRINALPGEGLELSWRSPLDASTRDLFRLDFAPILGEPWIEVSAGAFRHEAGRTFWAGVAPGGGANGSGYFRVRIVLN